jgi:hypothetical protein
LAVSCPRCGDRGLIEFTGGTHKSEYVQLGKLVIVEVEATPDRPVYKLCSCRHERPRVAEPPRTAAIYE